MNLTEAAVAAQLMSTLKQPATMAPPCAVMSPMRAAGCPAIKTVKLPSAITSGGPTQTHMSPTRAAGKPPETNKQIPRPVLRVQKVRHPPDGERTDQQPVEARHTVIVKLYSVRLYWFHLL